jgi:hypothetical protein
MVMVPEGWEALNQGTRGVCELRLLGHRDGMAIRGYLLHLHTDVLLLLFLLFSTFLSET